MDDYEVERGMGQESEFEPAEGPAVGKKAGLELEPEHGPESAPDCVDANPAEAELGHMSGPGPGPGPEPEPGAVVVSSQEHGPVEGLVSVTELGSLWFVTQSLLWTQLLSVVQTELSVP